MTAEIGVMNRIGLALAADSAVTVGREAQKVFSSADKLFQLAYAAPVGAMIYGSANYLSTPWETLIKAARDELGDRSFGTLREYGEFLREFLCRDTPPFTKEYEDEAFERLSAMLLLDIRNEMEERITKAAEAQDGLEEADVANILKNVATDRLAKIRGHKYMDGFSDQDMPAAASKAATAFAKQSPEIFGNLPLGEPVKAALADAVAEMAIRNYTGPMVSGVVIAGFGQGEYLPEMVAYEFEERVLGRPRLRSVTEHSLSATTSARIVPFAQGDSVAAFLEGVEPQLQREMKESVKVLFDGALDTILARVTQSDPQLGAELGEEMRPGLDEMLNRLFAGWRLMGTKFWHPILDMVAALPKDELAAVAESLVNLTKFRRRITPVHESVGGPIDVAVITKGDGFVWVKRKHYFPAELNPRAIARLQTPRTQ